ncbi:(Fe-S)-binding protein [Pseudodesulfovibrio sediminis]|uniref:Glycolate oxidase n=1 Tax=Pseudodesulfovibrio sediminis TaxID=2810563 RepID=A0ABM7P6K9_9BACT|nr:(Fe-S)-binding protein [Pseudodesulfovibrio sediminis]BCS88520.1 glycolate oxidase [Pseudodesulfovibrio sediminis]
MAGECILCGKCMEVCPLLRATGREELGPRAKADLCRVLVEDPDLLSEARVEKLAGLCLGCGRCRAVCSQGVDVPMLVAGLRQAHPDFKKWLWKTWLVRARELWSPGSTAARLIPKQFHTERFGPMLKMLSGLKGGPGLTPFLKIASFPDTVRGENMLLFAGCTATYVQSRWLMTALKLLDGLGVDVLPGEFKCCGSGLQSAGFADVSRSMAEHNVAVWRNAGKPRVVTVCASCKAGLEGYIACFASDEEQAEWGNSLLPLSEIIFDTECVISTPIHERLGYHHPCHATGVDRAGLFLHYALNGIIEMATDRECCGFGGVMRLGAADLTEPVNAACWDTLAGASVVVTGCSACIGQLKATAPHGVRVGHWLELIE